MSQIDGIKELERKLKQLSNLEQGKVIRAGVNAGGTALIKQARQRIPRGSVPHKTYKGRWVAPGFAARSIHKKTRLARDKKSASTIIGVKQEAFYAVQFLELGTSVHPKRPWLIPSYRAARQEMIDAFESKALQFIQKVKR